MEVNAALINFAAGQLSKKFIGRVDLSTFYNAGTLVCRNFVPQIQGPAEFRTGFQYVHTTRLNGLTTLYPFVFNDDQSYALAFSDQKLRFFSDGTIIMASASATGANLLLHMDGSDAGTTFTDSAGRHTVSAVGGAQTKTGQKKFGTASGYFDGSGDYLTVPASDDFAFGTGDFTIDFWAWFAAGSTASDCRALVDFGAVNEGAQLIWHADGYFQVNWGAVDVIKAGSAPTDETWTHFALTRESGTVRLFIDGTLVGSGTSTYDLKSNVTATIGAIVSSSYGFKGYIDEFRVVKGTAAWTANFTPPTAAYSDPTDTKIITNITQADPGVITSATHGFTGGEEVYLSGIGGMTELNGKYFLVVYIDGDTFSLTDIDGNAIDTTTYTAYTSGGIIDYIYEIDTPYLAADIGQLQLAQKADIMYIAHPDYEPRKLIRSGEASWTLATYLRTSDPFTKTITGITQANPGVVTATAHGFSNGDIVEINGVVGMTEVNERRFKVANKADNTFQLTDEDTGANVDTSGYTAYSSAGVVFLAGNMPGAVAFYAGRLFFGGTDEEPESFWGSKAPTNAGVTQYDDFTVGTNDGDAVTFPISSQNNVADRIQWFAGVNKFLAIGTYGGVYKANGGSDTTPISGTDIAVQAVEFLGCKYLAPVRVGSAIFYVQRGGLILNNFSFSLLADDYKATSLNIFSDEITKTGMTQLAVTQGVMDVIWAVTTEGKLIGMTVKLGEEINAWHSHEVGGTDVKVLSVCGEPQPDNKDSLWIVVERTINGSTRRYIEYQEADVVLPEPEDYYTGEANKVSDETAYESVLYETAKQLIRVDSALSLSGEQQVELTPGVGATVAETTGVTFTATSPVFAATDVGRYIVRKYVDGTESGRALITAYTSTMVVTCTILTAFDSVSAIPAGEWYLTFTSVTGLDHLEGETVAVQIDGEDDGTDYTVSSGAITLESAATYVHVGLRYTGRLTTMPLNIGAMVGTAQALTTTVNRLGVLFRHARKTLYGTDLYRLEEVKNRDISSVAYRPDRLMTNVEFLNIPDGYSKRKYVHIIQATANPCTVQGILPFVDTTNE